MTLNPDPDKIVAAVGDEAHFVDRDGLIYWQVWATACAYSQAGWVYFDGRIVPWYLPGVPPKPPPPLPPEPKTIDGTCKVIPQKEEGPTKNQNTECNPVNQLDQGNDKRRRPAVSNQ